MWTLTPTPTPGVVHKLFWTSSRRANKRGVKVNMFQYEVWPQCMPEMLYTADNFILVIFRLQNWKCRNKILLYVFLLVVRFGNSVQCVCACMVAILYTETSVTFHFDPSLISKLPTHSDLDWIKGIFGHNLVDDWLQNYIDEIAEIFDLTKKKKTTKNQKKKPTVCINFLFCQVYYLRIKMLRPKISSLRRKRYGIKILTWMGSFLGPYYYLKGTRYYYIKMSSLGNKIITCCFNIFILRGLKISFPRR